LPDFLGWVEGKRKGGRKDEWTCTYLSHMLPAACPCLCEKQKKGKTREGTITTTKQETKRGGMEGGRKLKTGSEKN